MTRSGIVLRIAVVLVMAAVGGMLYAAPDSIYEEIGLFIFGLVTLPFLMCGDVFGWFD